MSVSDHDHLIHQKQGQENSLVRLSSTIPPLLLFFSVVVGVFLFFLFFFFAAVAIIWKEYLLNVFLFSHVHFLNSCEKRTLKRTKWPPLRSFYCRSKVASVFTHSIQDVYLRYTYILNIHSGPNPLRLREDQTISSIHSCCVPLPINLRRFQRQTFSPIILIILSWNT